jgi:hypothetical protein
MAELKHIKFVQRFGPYQVGHWATFPADAPG